MSKDTKKQMDLFDNKFSTVIDCTGCPTNSEILSVKGALATAHLPTVDFYEREGVNIGVHSVIINEYHQIGEQIIIKGLEVITREVTGVINLENRTAKLKISNHGMNFSRKGK